MILKFTIKRVKDIQLTKTYEKVKVVSTVLLLKLTVELEAYSSAYHRYRAYGKHVRILYIRNLTVKHMKKVKLISTVIKMSGDIWPKANSDVKTTYIIHHQG